MKQKIEKVNEIINLINKTKKRLNKDLLGTKKLILTWWFMLKIIDIKNCLTY